jgi:hypothetical protein
VDFGFRDAAAMQLALQVVLGVVQSFFSGAIGLAFAASLVALVRSEATESRAG